MNFILFTALLISTGLYGVTETQRIAKLTDEERGYKQEADHVLGTNSVKRHDAAVKQTAIACWLARAIFLILVTTFVIVNRGTLL